jgi:hypothetical protein
MRMFSISELAIERYGAEESIVLHHLTFWVNINEEANKNFYDGHFWTYQTAEHISSVLHFFNKQKIWRILSKLEKLGAIKKGNYNKKGYDRTVWYTVLDEEILNINRSYKRQSKGHISKMKNGENQGVTEEKPETTRGHFLKMKNGFFKSVTTIPVSININKEEEREDITSTIITGEPKKEKAPATQYEGPKNFTEKVELMKSSLSDSKNEVKEKKEAPDEARANLFQGEINIKEFSPFSEYFLKEKNLKVKEHHLNFFLKWYNKHKAERLGTSIKAKIYYDILANDFKHAFNTYLENREIEEMQQKQIRQQDSKQDEKLKGLNIPVKSMLDFIDNLRLKAMQQA